MKIHHITALIVTVIFLQGCESIAIGTDQSITIETEPPGTIDKVISLGSYNIAIPGGWLHRTEAESDQRLITTIYHPDGVGSLKFMSLTTAPKVVTREILRNMTNVDSSITLDWQMWGEFSGYQYDYTEDGTFYWQWWLTNQEEILFFVYSSDSQYDSERKVINGIVASITAVN